MIKDYMIKEAQNIGENIPVEVWEYLWKTMDYVEMAKVRAREEIK